MSDLLISMFEDMDRVVDGKVSTAEFNRKYGITDRRDWLEFVDLYERHWVAEL
jgi:hypothetical protein